MSWRSCPATDRKNLPPVSQRGCLCLVELSKETSEEKDKLAPYNTGVETIVAGAIVLVIGLLFQIMGDDVRSRLSTATEAPTWAQSIGWIFWVAPFCYAVGAPVLLVGSYLIYRAYSRIHPSDKAQKQLTEYEDLDETS